jgi:hypothetical protein
MPGATVGTTITLIPTPELPGNSLESERNSALGSLPKSATIVPGLPTLAG